MKLGRQHNYHKGRVAIRHFQPGEGTSRGLLRDCTTGCGTDGALHSITLSSIQAFTDNLRSRK